MPLYSWTIRCANNLKLPKNKTTCISKKKKRYTCVESLCVCNMIISRNFGTFPPESKEVLWTIMFTSINTCFLEEKQRVEWASVIQYNWRGLNPHTIFLLFPPPKFFFFSLLFFFLATKYILLHEVVINILLSASTNK